MTPQRALQPAAVIYDIFICRYLKVLSPGQENEGGDEGMTRENYAAIIVNHGQDRGLSAGCFHNRGA